MAIDLQIWAFKGLVDETAFDRKYIDDVISCSVIREVRTSNLVREADMNAGFHTVSMVSASSDCDVLVYLL